MAREETDMLGTCEIGESSYFGIHTKRAVENFMLSAPLVHPMLIMELVLVKKACAKANYQAGLLEDKKANAIIRACDEILSGAYVEQFVVCSLQGGAGTSTNMNVNEVVANRANEILGGKKGDAHPVHPLNDVNMSQSTNDVYPTAIRIAAIRLVRRLSQTLSDLQEELQKKENEFSHIARIGRTQLMDALPMQVGQGFGAYAQAIARDRWRIYKAEERLRQVAIGGTAIGTGLNALPKYIYLVTEQLQSLTRLGIARAECPMDIIQNADVFVEVSGLLKACAVNLTKIANDLRLLSSGPFGGIGELILPPVQAGSTIMPGKVNPVIPEMVAQVCIRVMANDYAITACGASGQLELNAFLPMIAQSLLESLELLDEATQIFIHKCIKGITVNEKKCSEHLEKSSALCAGLIHYIGYDAAAKLAVEAQEKNITLREIALQKKILPLDQIERIFRVSEMTKPGIPGS